MPLSLVSHKNSLSLLFLPHLCHFRWCQRGRTDERKTPSDDDIRKRKVSPSSFFSAQREKKKEVTCSLIRLQQRKEKGVSTRTVFWDAPLGHVEESAESSLSWWSKENRRHKRENPMEILPSLGMKSHKQIFLGYHPRKKKMKDGGRRRKQPNKGRESSAHLLLLLSPH